MAIGIIDALEVVEIDQRQREGMVVGAREMAFEDIEEGPAIGQSGQRIGPGFQRSLKLLELALRYVANGDDEGRGLLLGRFDRTQLGFEPDGLAAAHDGPFENLRPPRMLRGSGKRGGNDLLIGIAEKHRQL